MIPYGKTSFITIGVANTFYYTNHRGERRLRRMIPLCLRYGTTPYHKEPQWLLECSDCELILEGTVSYRTLALKDVEILHTTGAELEPPDASNQPTDTELQK